MNLIDQAIKEAMPIWNECLNHPFIKELCDGTLPESKIKKYIVEDSIYLREYAKCFAYGILNSKTLEDTKTFYTLMSYINESEGSTRLKYMKKFNLTDEMLNDYIPEIECKNYYEFMINESKKGKLECMMSVLPCMLSYLYIFKTKNQNNEINKNTPYIDLINDYLSDMCKRACEKWSEYANKLSININEEKKKELIAIFKKSSECELEFWNMSYNK